MNNFKSKSKSKNVGVLFTGGKDSCYALFLAKKEGHAVQCLITIESQNPDSFMFHTPSISQVRKQAEVLQLPLIIQKTTGVKEEELEDLKKAIILAKDEFKIEGIVTGAVESVYQSSRIKNICRESDLECFNPLWHKNQISLLEELIALNFEVMIVGVAAYPLDASWLGRMITKEFVKDVKILKEKYGINPAGEGGEFETFVLNCPIFSRKLDIVSSKITGEKNAFRMELVLD